MKDKLPAISSPDLPPLEMKSHDEAWSHLFSTLQFLYKHPQGAWPPLKGNTEQIQREIQMSNTVTGVVAQLVERFISPKPWF